MMPKWHYGGKDKLFYVDKNILWAIKSIKLGDLRGFGFPGIVS